MTLSNLTLADRYAEAKARAEEAEALLKVIRDEILATGVERLDGEFASVTVALSERASLDAASVKKLLTPEQVQAVTKTTLVTTLRVKPVVHA